MNARTLILTSPVLVAILAGGLSAQDPRIGLELRTGVVNPTTELGRTSVLEGAGYVTFGQADAAFMLGAGVLGRLSDAWSIRISLDRQFDSHVDGVWACAPFVACPAVLIEPEGELQRWALGGDVRFRVASVPGPIQPVVFTGGGIRWSRLRWSSPIPEVPIPMGYEEQDLFWSAGLGLNGAMGPLEVFGEAGGTVGPFGAEAVQYIEGLVPDGRVTGVDFSVVLGVRAAIR